MLSVTGIPPTIPTSPSKLSSPESVYTQIRQGICKSDSIALSSNTIYKMLVAAHSPFSEMKVLLNQMSQLAHLYVLNTAGLLVPKSITLVCCSALNFSLYFCTCSKIPP